MNAGWICVRRPVRWSRPARTLEGATGRLPRRSQRLAASAVAALAAGILATAAAPASAHAGHGAARQAASGLGYQATIVRTAYGIPHITARNFGSLGFGYGFALASDDLCTMANGYVTVEARRSRYFGATFRSSPGPPVTLARWRPRC